MALSNKVDSGSVNESTAAAPSIAPNPSLKAAPLLLAPVVKLSSIAPNPVVAGSNGFCVCVPINGVSCILLNP